MYHKDLIYSTNLGLSVGLFVAHLQKQSTISDCIQGLRILSCSYNIVKLGIVIKMINIPGIKVHIISKIESWGWIPISFGLTQLFFYL